MGKTRNYKYYLRVINLIQKTRSKNNINWMGLLKLSFKHAPKDTIKILKKINSDDKKISSLFEKLIK